MSKIAVKKGLDVVRNVRQFAAILVAVAADRHAMRHTPSAEDKWRL